MSVSGRVPHQMSVECCWFFLFLAIAWKPSFRQPFLRSFWGCWTGKASGAGSKSWTICWFQGSRSGSHHWSKLEKHMSTKVIQNASLSRFQREFCHCDILWHSWAARTTPQKQIESKRLPLVHWSLMRVGLGWNSDSHRWESTPNTK